MRGYLLRLRPFVLIAVLTMAGTELSAFAASEQSISKLNSQFCELEARLKPLEELGYVAHAGGSPSGLSQEEAYTNSREAFEISYQNGFRAFEFDLLTLGDGTVVVAHNGKEDKYGLSKNFKEASRADVESARWRGKYPLLFAEDLIALMAKYKDIWVILDTKWDHLEIAEVMVSLTSDSTILDRIVPHLRSDSHTWALPGVYSFPEKMVALYGWPASDNELLTRMARYGVDNVMMWGEPDNMRWSEETQVRLEEAGYHVWVHTPQNPEDIRAFRARGVGVYSNGYIEDCERLRR